MVFKNPQKSPPRPLKSLLSGENSDYKIFSARPTAFIGSVTTACGFCLSWELLSSSEKQSEWLFQVGLSLGHRSQSSAPLQSQKAP